MNISTIRKTIGVILCIEAAFMLPPLALSFGFREAAARHAFAITIALCLVLAGLTLIFPPRRKYCCGR